MTRILSNENLFNASLPWTQFFGANSTNPIPIFLSLQKPVSHLVNPTGSNVVVSSLGFEWRQPVQNFGLLVGYGVVISHIVKRYVDVKAVDIIAAMMLRHFRF